MGMKMSKVKIKLLTSTAKLPVYATDGAACFDIYADDIIESGFVGDNFVIQYSTGLAFELPEGKALMVYSRSGDGIKRHITLSNSTGIIDSDYRGELIVQLESDVSTFRDFPKAGERICQAMIIDAPQYDFEVVDELSETGREAGGFGSTGRE